MQVMGSDLAPSKGRGQWMSVWRFIAETGNQLSPTVFAVVGATLGYVGAFGVVGLGSRLKPLNLGFDGRRLCAQVLNSLFVGDEVNAVAQRRDEAGHIFQQIAAEILMWPIPQRRPTRRKELSGYC